MKQSGPKDVFLHLLSIAGLYTVVISFGALVFGFINLGFPDVLQYDYYARSSLRWPLAILTIVFPLFVLLSWYLEKDLKKNPEKENLKTRKWLLTFTLAAAAIVIVGDLVTLLYNYLNGELTIRFLLKVLTVFVVAKAVFGYYLWDLRKDLAVFKKFNIRYFVWGMIVIVLAAIIWGFMQVGSPKSERLRRFDEEKINHLNTIQGEIINYWQTKEKLPPNLASLTDNIRGFVAPKDPQSGADYEYSLTGDLSFELCANFNFSNKEESVAGKSGVRPLYPEPYYNQNWLHGAGVACFARDIDPELYPVFNKTKPLR